MSADPSASHQTGSASDAAGAQDDDAFGSNRKRKRPNVPTKAWPKLPLRKSIESHLAPPPPPEASAYDPEHSKLHVEIYNYFSGLHSQLLRSEAVRGGRERNLRAGVSVRGIGEVLTKLEKTFRHVGEYKRSQDEIRKRREEEKKNARDDGMEENDDVELPVVPTPPFNPISLSTNPKSLMDLWEEYKIGIGGRKPAEQFTRKERNSSNTMKQKYCRRNHIWSVMSRLVNSGLTPEQACEEIIGVYGKLSIKDYIEGMIRDKKRNPVSKCHPQLYQLLRKDGAVQAGPAAGDGPVELSESPQTLELLWTEYKFGLDGRKPAQQFTRKERNSNKQMKQIYCRRNVIWTTMERLVGAGNTPEEACRKIEAAYPGKSITGIITEMVWDKKRYPETKCHPSLV